jgi:hypothetical protein
MPQLNVSICKMPMLASWNARFCSQHVQRAVQAQNAVIVHQVAECEKAIDVARSFAAAVRERQEEAGREMDTLEMDIAGRISRQSGPTSDMYELPDGSFECVLRNGEAVKPWCWLQGGHVIKHQTAMIIADSAHNQSCQR